MPARIVTAGSCLSSQMPEASQVPVLASEPARCNWGKSVKEIDNVKNLKTNKVRGFLGSEADGDPGESGRVNKQTSNKQNFLQQQHHQQNRE